MSADEGSERTGVTTLRWFLPSSPLQVVVGVMALLFLAGSLGYFVGVVRTRPPAGAVDVGFMQDMVIHHQQAVEMSLEATERAQDPVVRGFAREILIIQNREIGVMTQSLAARGKTTRDPADGPAMHWMGMSVPTAQMPGLATEAQMRRLRELNGREFYIEFLKLMTAHHQGGIQMAAYAADRADDPDVRDLAGRMVSFQRTEVNEFSPGAPAVGAVISETSDCRAVRHGQSVRLRAALPQPAMIWWAT